jgi:hypothetical protein
MKVLFHLLIVLLLSWPDWAWAEEPRMQATAALRLSITR